MSNCESELGGDLDPDQLAGRRYRVTIAETVEYRLTVLAGTEQQDAVDEAQLRAHHGDETPSDRDLVHSDVEAIEDIWADDPRAEQCSEWIDGPAAPSDETFWDDGRHFSEDVRTDD